MLEVFAARSLELVMCWLGLEARGQAKPRKIGLGLRFSKPEAKKLAKLASGSG